MIDLERFASILAADRHLGVLVTTGVDRLSPQVSVVNAGVLDHPTTGHPVVGLVARRGPKLANLRVEPTATVVARAGWEWIALRGSSELSGPDDPALQLDSNQQRQLLLDIYHAAGGIHPDLDRYSHTMLAERRCAVLISPEHTWTNPAGSEHREANDRNIP